MDNKNLQKTLLEAGVPEKVLKKLARHGVTTLGDLSKYYISEIRDFVHRRPVDEQIIRDVARKNGVSFRKVEYFTRFDESKIDYVDFYSLSDEEKKAFLSRPVTDIGINEKLAQRLATHGVYNIGDLVNRGRTDIRNIAGNNDVTGRLIRERLEKFNIVIASQDELYHFNEPVIPVKDIKDMNGKEKIEFLMRPLSDIGVSNRVISILKDRGVKKIGDVESLSEKEVKKLFTGLSFSTYKRFLETIAQFGIEKEEVIYDRKFTEGTIEKVDFETISDEEKEEYYANSISGLGFSKDIQERLKKVNVETIGDLVKMSRKDIREMITKNPYALRRIKAVMDDYGLEFVNLHTYISEPKIERVDVSKLSKQDAQKILELPIQSLGITGKMVDVLKKEKNIETIKELIGLKISDMKAINKNNSNSNIFAIRDRLSDFGLSFAPEEKKSRYFRDDMIEHIDITKLSEDEKAKLLNLKLENFKFNKNVVRNCNEIGVTTLGQLIEMPKSEFRQKSRLNSIVVQEVEKTLADLGISMKGSNCYVVDGKVVSKLEDIKKLKTQRTVELVDVNTLSGKEKEEYLKTPISELGLHVRAIDLIEKKTYIKTLGDFQGMYLGEFEKMLASNDEYIEHTLNVLGECGIHFERKPQNLVSRNKTLKDKAEINAAKYTNPEEIANLPLTEIGISTRRARKFAEVGIYTVQDLANKSRNQIFNLSNGNYKFVNQVNENLARFGFALNQDTEIKFRKPKDQEIAPLSEQFDEETRNYYCETSFESVGFGKKLSRILTQLCGVDNLSGIIDKTPVEIYQILGENDIWYYKTRELLKEEGINMPNLMYVKRDMIENGVGATGSNSSENKYYARQMQHYNRYLSYVKARNKQQLDEDFKI